MLHLLAAPLKFLARTFSNLATRLDYRADSRRTRKNLRRPYHA